MKAKGYLRQVLVREGIPDAKARRLSQKTVKTLTVRAIVEGPEHK